MLRIRRRSLRKGLLLVGCLVGVVSYPHAAVGLGLIALGAALHFWSKGCLEQNRRLTTAGPYRWTRNPFYLANLLIDLGICFVIGNLWVSAIFVALWGVSYRETIAREEARLLALFPDEYKAYRAVVPRLIPNGRSLPASSVTGRFSFDNDGLARGAEYARLLGIALAPLTIAAAESIRRDGLALLDEHHTVACALVLMVPALWIVKLGLAETFRRPETALVPWVTLPHVRAALALVLAIIAYDAGTRRLWFAILPALWSVLCVLDAMGDRRRGTAEAARPRITWRYFPAVATGSFVGFVCISALNQ